MSAALVDSMAADFEPDQFTDDYQLQLRQLIEAKLEKGESLDTEETFGVPAAEAGSGEGSVSTSGAPAGPEADPLPGTESSRQERESDDDEDQDDDFDDAQPLGLRGTLWGTPSLMASFGATPSHDPACSNHRLLDPRPPRRR